MVKEKINLLIYISRLIKGFTKQEINEVEKDKPIQISKHDYESMLSDIKSNWDIVDFVNIFMANTSDSTTPDVDEFWIEVEKTLYRAYIGLIIEAGNKKERNFKTLINFVNASHVNEEDDTQKNVMDLLFEEHGNEFPESFAYSQYNNFKLAAGKKAKSILISASVRLAPFDTKDVIFTTIENEYSIHY